MAPPAIPAPTARPLRADAERNRRRLLDAAREVLGRDGLDASTDAVARAAGVGVGTLYRRFPTKQELLDAVLGDMFAELEAGLREAALVGDPLEAVHAAAWAFAGSCVRDRALLQALDGSCRLPPGFEAGRLRLRELLEPMLDRAQAAGVVRADVDAADVLLLAGNAARLPDRRLREEPELWRRYVGLALDALRPGPAPSA